MLKKTNVKTTIIAVVLSIIFFFSIVFAQSSAEYQRRRKLITDTMEPNSVLILKSKGTPGEFEPFRQDNNFYYLTGLNEPDAALVLHKPDSSGINRNVQENSVLFITPRNTSRRDWDPETLGLEGAHEKLGFQNARPFQEFQNEFENLLMGEYSTIYLNYERSRRLNDPLTADEYLINKAREKGAQFEIKSPDPFIAALRTVKSPAEVENLRTAINITAEAHLEAMRSMRSGMTEYQLQAIIEHVFAINGTRPGFNSIVASGPNSVILHWSENSRKMRNGDMVVVDIGAEYNMYTADVSRTIPVSGKFTERQREIYSAVLAAQKAGIDVLRPGVTWSEVTDAIHSVLIERLQELNMIQDRSELRKYLYHGLGHGIGLYVHDSVRLKTLEPDMVFTIEPGIYIREEGLGIRIEDNFLITETGYVHLSENVPRDIDEIEAIMKEKGTDFSRYIIKK